MNGQVTALITNYCVLADIDIECKYISVSDDERKPTN